MESTYDVYIPLNTFIYIEGPVEIIMDNYTYYSVVHVCA